MNLNESNVKKYLDIGECPLCKEMIQGLMTTHVTVPEDKLNTNTIKASVFLEPVCMQVEQHYCEKVERPKFQGRNTRYGTYDPNILVATDITAYNRLDRN